MKNKIAVQSQILTVILLCLLLIPSAYSFYLSEQFVDNKYGYSIRYPSSWNVSKHRSGVVLANIDSGDGKSGLQIRLINSNKGINSFINSYISDFTNQMQATLMNRNQTMFGYRRGYSITFRSRRGSVSYFLKTYILPVENTSKFYIFQAGTPFEMKNQVEPVLDGIAASFRYD
jgi:hypothetical protein